VRDARVARLFDAVLTVTEEVELERVLERIIVAARDLLGVRYAALGVLAEADEGLAQFVHTGMTDAEVAAIGHLPRGLGLLGAVVHEPRALRLDDLPSDPRAVGLPRNHPPMRDFLGVPVRIGERVYGSIYLSEKRDGSSFTAEDEDLVVGLAAVAGTAISGARLVAELRAREAWRDAVATITSAVLTGASSRAVHEEVVGVVRDLLEADGVALVVEDAGVTEVVA
jgi:GAF domain-containing protein